MRCWGYILIEKTSWMLEKWIIWNLANWLLPNRRQHFLVIKNKNFIDVLDSSILFIFIINSDPRKDVLQLCLTSSISV